MDYRDYRKKYGAATQDDSRSGGKKAQADTGYADFRKSYVRDDDTAATVTRQYDRTGDSKKRRKRGARTTSAKIVLVMIIALSAVLVLMLLLLAVTSSSFIKPSFLASRVTAEAGRSSISASDFLTDKSREASFAEGNDYSLSKVGTYQVKIIVDGKTYTTTLVVRDTVAPYAEAEPVVIRTGDELDASLCVKNVRDATQVSAEFKDKDNLDLSTEGVKNVTVILTDEGGNATEIESSVTVLKAGALLVDSKVIECGSTVPDVSAFVGKGASGEYVTDISSIRTTEPGTYILEIRTEDGTHEVTLIVRDTIPPTAEIHPVSIFRNGEIPDDPSVMLSNIRDVTKVTVTYDPVPVNDGNFPIAVRLKLTDTSGNATYLESRFEEVTDYEPPVIRVLNSSVSCTLGDDDFPWREAVEASDNSGTAVTLSASAPKRIVNGEAVDGYSYKTTAGKYAFTVTAEDAVGNKSSVDLELYVREISFTEAEFNDAVAKFTARMTKPSMTLMQKLEALYKYLSANSWSQIHYTNDSQHDDWMKEAYSVITKIPNQAKSDCFGFAAVAKAAIDSWGCETMIIERNPRSEAGTHFWVAVNLGTHDDPKWYHFDGTPMRGDFKIPAYALTDYQLEAYTRWRDDKLTPAPHYYRFDRTLYGYTPSTEIICPTPQIPNKYYS